MALADILYKKKPPMAFVSLNRPETRNTFTVPMIDSVCLAIEDAKEDPDIKVIVLSGEGEAFSAGGNIKDMADGKLASWDMKRYLWDHVQRIPLLLEDVDKPVIAVPTSIGYGASFGGITPLLAMLNSCASNVTVVNIDNGFGAGYVAVLINTLANSKKA